MVGIFFSCKNDMNHINKVVIDDDTSQETMDTVVSLITDLGKSKVLLTAPKINKIYEPIPETHCPTGIKVVFYDTANVIQGTLTANRGIIMETKNRIEVFNNVILHNAEEQKTLYTEHLIWEQKRIKGKDSSYVKSDVPVRVTEPNNEYFADDIFADEKLNYYKGSNPRAKILVDSLQIKK